MVHRRNKESKESGGANVKLSKRSLLRPPNKQKNSHNSPLMTIAIVFLLGVVLVQNRELLSGPFDLLTQGSEEGRGNATAVTFSSEEKSLDKVIPFDRESCVASIHSVVNPLLTQVPTMLSKDRLENVRDTMIKAMFEPDLVGDFVETGTWKGGASLLAATVQRTALKSPSCGNVRHRGIWLADSFEGLPESSTLEDGFQKGMDPAGSYKFDGGVHAVKKMFENHGFQTDGSGDVPVHFLVGWFNETLPDSLISDIAVLRLDGDMYESTLDALFALYRRTRVGGYIIIDDYGHWPQCKKAIDEFFSSTTIDLQKIDYTGRWFQKPDTRIRIPKIWHEQIKYHPLVEKNFHKVGEWLGEVKRRYVGHDGKNPYQTYRYTAALRHLQMSRGKSRINICETGFNAGHSAMMFLALNSPDHPLHYYGWDLGTMGAARPMAAKISEYYPNNFHIFWGNTRQTLTQLQSKEVLDDQRCDMVVIDGEHSYDGVKSDVSHFLKVASPGTIFFVDDCQPPYDGIVNAFNEFVGNKTLIAVAYYSNPELKSPGFSEAVVPDESGNYVLGYQAANVL